MWDLCGKEVNRSSMQRRRLVMMNAVASILRPLNENGFIREEKLVAASN
jgi:hypothetical protein